MSDKTFTCLIPYYRLDKLSAAVTSATSDGWHVETMLDKNAAGVHKMREALLNIAFVSNETKFIRYLDDDDILLPHRQQLQDAFEANPEVALIYSDYIMKTPMGAEHHIKFSGNPLEDCMRVHPWSWVARREALHRIKDIYGYLWDYDHPCREGTYAWIKFLEVGMRIKHIPIESYYYTKSNNPECVGNHPFFARETLKVQAILKNLQQ